MIKKVSLSALQESAIRVLSNAPFGGYEMSDACQTLATSQAVNLLSAHTAINAVVEFGGAHTYKRHDGATIVGLTVEGADVAETL